MNNAYKFTPQITYQYTRVCWYVKIKNDETPPMLSKIKKSKSSRKEDLKDLTGLSNREAKKLLDKFGENKIIETQKRSVVRIFLSEFNSPLVLVLIAAAVISIAINVLPGQTHGYLDALLIIIIVIISAVAAFFQDYKAEKSIQALQAMATPQARVVRDGREQLIPTTQIVKGDLLILGGGDVVPADAKLVKAYNLKLDESVLTGESRQVEKKINETVYMNSSVYSGEAMALVTKTGLNTRVGDIAIELEQIEDSPGTFEKEINELSGKVTWLIGGISIFLLAVGVFKFGFYEAVLIAISLAVAAIPEGLMAVVVLTLAIGATVMSKKKALLRRLSVAESIGDIDVICTDKTGTLTKNEMTVTNFYLDSETYSADLNSLNSSKTIDQLLLAGALCNTTRREEDETGKLYYSGDQTEIAIRKFSDKLNYVKEKLSDKMEKVSEMSFTSERKMMSVLLKNKNDNKYYIYSKGAPEVLLEKCDSILENGEIHKLSPKKRSEILKHNTDFAEKSLRVLGFAYKRAETKPKRIEEHLVWIGLEAMMDPPRRGISHSLSLCRAAGIRVIMITGDGPDIAQAISKHTGLESTGVIIGKELDDLSNKNLERKINSGISIFARTSPEHKLRILEIISKNYRVAMTGDGVNDALALKKADVGISMALKGTEVAKQASDMILLDDNFSTIVTGVKEGRKIFQNIRKFINYLFTCNIAEVSVIFFATLFFSFGGPVLLPIHILWINLLTDGLTALALGVDPAAENLMQQPPRHKKEGIINRYLAWQIIVIGIKKSIIIMLIFLVLRPMGFDIARSGLFTAFILYEFVRISTIRYQEKLSWFSNKWLLGAMVFSILSQVIVLYTPLNQVFHVVPLGIKVWIILSIGVVIGYFLSIIIIKILSYTVGKKQNI